MSILCPTQRCYMQVIISDAESDAYAFVLPTPCEFHDFRKHTGINSEGIVNKVLSKWVNEILDEIPNYGSIEWQDTFDIIVFDKPFKCWDANADNCPMHTKTLSIQLAV